MVGAAVHGRRGSGGGGSIVTFGHGGNNIVIGVSE